MYSQPFLVGNNDNESGGGALSFTGAKTDPAALAKQNAGFTCPPQKAAESRLKAGLPTWRYRYMGTYANTAMGAGPATSSHGSELTIVWGTMDVMKKGASTPDEIVLSKKVRKAWASFAKDPKEGLSKLGWPLYDSSKPTLALLGDNNKPDIKFVSPATYDSACEEYWKATPASSPPKGP
jgi:cholinesterase